MKTRLLSLFLLLLFIMGSGCSSVNQTVSKETSEGDENMNPIRIVILSGDANTLKLGYEYADAWQIIQAEEDELLVIEESDFQYFDWQNQIIALNEAGTEKIKSYIPEITFQKNAFVMQLGKKKVYGGVINEVFSAARIRYPTMYILQGENNNYELSIKPYHHWKEYSEFSLDEKRIIEIEEIYNRLEEIRKLK